MDEKYFLKNMLKVKYSPQQHWDCYSIFQASVNLFIFFENIRNKVFTVDFEQVFLRTSVQLTVSDQIN